MQSLAMTSGWIKLHRSILNWELADDPKAVALWVYLLLAANHEPKVWRGLTIGRGQLVTGREKLSKKTGISQQSIRNQLKVLQATNQISIKATNQYSIITICNYDKYQDVKTEDNQQNNQQPNQQTTSKRPTINHKQEVKKKEERIKNNTFNGDVPNPFVRRRADPFFGITIPDELAPDMLKWIEFNEERSTPINRFTVSELLLKYKDDPQGFSLAISEAIAGNYKGPAKPSQGARNGASQYPEKKSNTQHNFDLAKRLIEEEIEKEKMYES